VGRVHPLDQPALRNNGLKREGRLNRRPFFGEMGTGYFIQNKVACPHFRVSYRLQRLQYIFCIIKNRGRTSEKAWQTNRMKAIKKAGTKAPPIAADAGNVAAENSAMRLERVTSAMLSLGADSGKNLETLVGLACALLGADCARYSRLEGDNFIVRASRGGCLEKTAFKAAGTLCAAVLGDREAGRGIVLRKLSLFSNAECLVEKGFRSYFGHPVKFENGKGVLSVLYKKAYEPDEEDRKLFGIIASAVGLEESRSAGEAKRRQADEAVKNVVLFQQMLLDAIPAPIFYKDAECVYLGGNKAFERYIGLPQKQFVGKTVFDISPGDLAEKYDKADRKLMNSPGVDSYEASVVYADGTRHEVIFNKATFTDAKGKVAGLTGVILDITERRKAETDIREAYEMQRLLNAMLKRSISNAPLREKLDRHLSALLAAPWLSVEAKGAVFLTNHGERELVMAAQQGLSPVLVTACAKVPFGHCVCGRAAATGEPVASLRVGAEHDVTYEGMKPHGHYCAPIKAENKVLGVLNLYLKEGDKLTESQERFVKAAADVMAGNILHSQVEESLSQAQKMQAVGLLAGGVAHDFNNILTAIKCYAGLIEKELSPGDPKFSDTQEILNSVERAIGLTQQLLAFSRRQILAPRVVEVNKVLCGMADMIRRIIGENIVLETRLSSVPCLTRVDPGQLEQVMMNLAVNARDAMPGGGTITFESEVIYPPEEFFSTHSDLPYGPVVCIKVRDTGSGMSEEVKNRLFEPFFTTKQQGKGTGLGLSMVFGIVKQSGGEIGVESEPGKGSVFTVYLPLEASQLPDKTKAADTRGDKERPGVRHETVLFVEDEESLRRLGSRMLSAGGYTAILAASGKEALKLMEERGKPVDLLVTDVVMPGMSGRELARELAKRKLVGRVLYMSGYTDDYIVKHGVLESGIAFIYKPFTVEAMLLKLREVLDGPQGQAKV